MDFQKYYSNQARENLPVFTGAPYQRGYGFGSVFKRFFRWAIPIIKQHAAPVVRNVGKEVLKSAVNIATDTLEGHDLKSSAKTHVKNSLNNISKQYGSAIRKKSKKSRVFKKANENKFGHSNNRLNKRRLDIFD